jgi:hypothetical protein
MDCGGESADRSGEPRGEREHIGCGTRHGVARGLLTAWRRQLSSDGISQEPQQGFAAVKIDTVASVSNEAPRYSVEPAAVATALAAVRGRGRIEIDIAGARIRVTLSMVLAAVRGDN